LAHSDAKKRAPFNGIIGFALAIMLPIKKIDFLTVNTAHVLAHVLAAYLAPPYYNLIGCTQPGGNTAAASK
jgi:hypothetical protein